MMSASEGGGAIEKRTQNAWILSHKSVPNMDREERGTEGVTVMVLSKTGGPAKFLHLNLHLPNIHLN